MRLYCHRLGLLQKAIFRCVGAEIFSDVVEVVAEGLSPSITTTNGRQKRAFDWLTDQTGSIAKF